METFASIIDGLHVLTLRRAPDLSGEACGQAVSYVWRKPALSTGCQKTPANPQVINGVYIRFSTYYPGEAGD